MSGPINNIVKKIIDRSNKKLGIINPGVHGGNPIIGAGRGYTDGSSLWSGRETGLNFQLSVTNGKIGHYSTNDHSGNLVDNYAGNLNAYFDPNVWDIQSDGFIYTDNQFESFVQQALRKSGFKYYNLVEYSERGMQGGNFVNFDMGEKLSMEIIEKGLAEIDEWNI